MGHTLTFEVPEKVYDSLRKSAAHIGQLPEVLAANLLAEATERLENDPLEEFIGTLKGSIPNWADSHDQYIGKSVRNSMDNTKDN
ncbi:MAG: hypothetical protein F4X51_13880 [Gemmatimonadetes bacterium]|nr:hypothetical protein [Gemmatimonadota bacterium]